MTEYYSVKMGSRFGVYRTGARLVGWLIPQGVELVARRDGMTVVTERANGRWDAVRLGGGKIGVASSPPDGLLMVARVCGMEENI